MNHLIIGLGGTGGRIIRSFRKMLFNFRSATPDVNIEYLYVDSDDRPMALDDPDWKVMGESVQLAPRNQLKIKSADLRKCLANQSNYPELQPWLGTEDDWKEVLTGVADPTIGGQKRRLGRFLFSRGIGEFNAKVQTLVEALQSKGDKQVTFHVICGLAGGTGSGSVIDAIAQIRKAYPPDLVKDHPLVLYCLLPEKHPKPTWNKGNYWANGYAALSELNAFSVRRFSPTDLSSHFKPAPRIDLDRIQTPFDGCYLISNENDQVELDVESDELPDIIASFLYQKIVVVRDTAWHVQLGKIESCENGDRAPETSPKSGQPERSRSFLTFGVKRLAYPEDEIQEYITYHFGLQAANQLRFNNWVENIGYDDKAKNQAFQAQVKSAELMGRWRLSVEHLTLSKGILPDDADNKSWKSIHNEWHDLISPYTNAVEGGQNPQWLAEIKRLFDERYEKGFRRSGVASFYSARLAAKNPHSREICSIIENHLFEDWTNGERSMTDTSQLLAALIQELDVRRKILDTMTTSNNAEAVTNDAQITANGTAWGKLGILGRFVGEHHKLLNRQAICEAKHYEYLTLAEGLEFAKKLVAQVSQDLSELKGSVDMLSSQLSKVTEQYKEQLKQRIPEEQGVAAAANGGEVEPQTRQGHEQVVRFFDPIQVIRITRAMTVDPAGQKTGTTAVRTALVQIVRESKNFKTLAEMLTLGVLRDTIDSTCAKLARVAHENLVKTSQQRVLGINIVDKLRERYDGDRAGLQLFIKDLMDHAKPYLVLDDTEQARNVDGLPQDREPVSNMTVILPASNDAGFAAQLAAEFQNFAPSGGASIVTSSNRKNEIVIVSLKNLFPLRYAKLVGFLRDRYEERAGEKAQNSKRIRLEVHTEGDPASLPRLFLASDAETVKDTVPYILLAHGMDIIRQMSNPQGVSEFALALIDEDGLPLDPIFLGKKLSDSASRIDFGNADLIRTEVEKLLAGYKSDPDRREKLRKAIVADIDLIQAERGKDYLNDDVFRRFRDGGRTALGMLKQMAAGA